MPTSAQSISRNAVMFRALSTDPPSHGINSRCAAGWFLYMWSNDSCSAGSEGTKITLKKKRKKKSDLLSTLKVKRWEKYSAAFSPSAKSWQKGALYFFKDPDSAYKEWISCNKFVFYTVSRRNNPILICLLRASTSFPLLIMDVWDLNTGKIMVVWRWSRQWQQGTSHSQ